MSCWCAGRWRHAGLWKIAGALQPADRLRCRLAGIGDDKATRFVRCTGRNLHAFFDREDLHDGDRWAWERMTGTARADRTASNLAAFDAVVRIHRSAGPGQSMTWAFTSAPTPTGIDGATGPGQSMTGTAGDDWTASDAGVIGFAFIDAVVGIDRTLRPIAWPTHEHEATN
jgi:hypothetical protein